MTKILNLQTISNGLMVLSFLLVVLSIFQIGLYTREKCLISKYQNKIFSLSEYNKSLTLNFTKASSLANADNYVSDESFIEPNNIEYIEVVGGSVATRNQ